MQDKLINEANDGALDVPQDLCDRLLCPFVGSLDARSFSELVASVVLCISSTWRMWEVGVYCV